MVGGQCPFNNLQCFTYQRAGYCLRAGSAREVVGALGGEAGHGGGGVVLTNVLGQVLGLGG